MPDKIAVIVVAYNMADLLKDCMRSLLSQTIKDFRLIIVDDASSDNTQDAVKGFGDNRVSYTRNSEHLGIARTRNKALTVLDEEELVFFIDADCIADPSWLEAGFRMFSNSSSVMAAEGSTTYAAEGYRPRLSERAYHADCKQGLFQTHNCAYRRAVIRKIKKFDEQNFNELNEDTDFFYRAKKAFPLGEFLSCQKMKVIHQKSEWDIPHFFKDAKKVKYFLRLIKKHGRMDFGAGRLGSFIISPNNLLLSVFPPAILFYLLSGRRRIAGIYDLVYVLLYPLKAYYYRILVWYYAVQEKVPVI